MEVCTCRTRLVKGGGGGGDEIDSAVVEDGSTGTLGVVGGGTVERSVFSVLFPVQSRPVRRRILGDF